MSEAEVLAAQRVADTVCTSLSLIAVALTKQDAAAMSPTEQAIIKPSLVATLTELSEQAKQQIDKYANPTMLIAGFGLWAYRLSGLTANTPAKSLEPRSGSNSSPAGQSAVDVPPNGQRPGRVPVDGVAAELRGDKLGGVNE